MTTPLDEKGLLPCPFCGGPARTFQYNGTTQASCTALHTECAGTDVIAPVAMWNRRALSTVALPDELEVVAWAHPDLGWAHAEYGQVLMHCPMDGEGPVALARADQAHSTIAALREKDTQRLDHIKKLERRIHNQRRSNRDTWEIVESRNRWLGSPEARKAFARLLVRHRAAEAEVKRLTEEKEALRKALKPFTERSRAFDDAAMAIVGAVPAESVVVNIKTTHGHLRAARKALEASK